MVFALYEADSEESTFIRVAVEDDYDSIESIERERDRESIDRGDGPIQEHRIVPAEDKSDLPMHAENEELLELINANNDMYPRSW